MATPKNKMASEASSTTFSLTYGEESQLPLNVVEADIHIDAVPSQQLASVRIALTVLNDTIQRDIEAALRFPLPNDATVCGFQLDENAAIAVPCSKAAEVAYREKEKGRAVATTASVQGAVFETTIFPLPFGTQRSSCLLYTPSSAPTHSLTRSPCACP